MCRKLVQEAGDACVHLCKAVFANAAGVCELGQQGRAALEQFLVQRVTYEVPTHSNKTKPITYLRVQTRQTKEVQARATR